MSEQLNRDKLLAAIKSDDPNTRTDAWLRAGQVGPSALQPLAQLMAAGNTEVALAAKRGMWKITHTVGAPEAAGKSEAVAALLNLLDSRHADDVRREALWMLSDIASDRAATRIATLLADKNLREDARMVLERLPGDGAVEALRRGFQAAPEQFKYNLAQSLRKRGQHVDGYPCQKHVATRPTQVKPIT